MRNLPVIWRRTFGIIMIALGAFVFVRVYLQHRPSQFGQTMDTIFALFFIVRGSLYLRMARNRAKPGVP